MADSLSRYLTRLSALLSSDALQRGVDASNTVVDLSSFCLENVSQGELGAYIYHNIHLRRLQGE